jgi:hypothetical protein
MKITKKVATKLHSAASRNQKEWACLEITKYKLQTIHLSIKKAGAV